MIGNRSGGRIKQIMKEKYKKNRKALLFLILSVCLISGLVSIRNQYISYPIADGFLNLSEENLEEKAVQLNGVWKFYEGTLEDTSSQTADSLEVPGSWRGKVINGKKLGKHGIGVYELRVRVPSPGDYCMKLNYVSSAYQLYINDKKVVENGRIGADKSTEIPSWAPQFVYFHADQSDLVIKIKVSNFHCNNGGIVLPVYIGKQVPLFRFHLFNLMKNIGFIGILAGMACYLYVFNWCLNKKAQSVYLWIFCISVLISASIIDGESLVSIFPFLTIDAVLKTEYMSFMVQITSRGLAKSGVRSQESGAGEDADPSHSPDGPRPGSRTHPADDVTRAGFTDVAVVQIGDENQEEFLEFASDVDPRGDRAMDAALRLADARIGAAVVEEWQEF